MTEPRENGSGGAKAAPGSILDKIKTRRVELQRERHLDKDIPGYSGRLVARLNPVPWDDLKKISKKVEKLKDNPRVELISHTDTIIAATAQLLVREVPGGPLKPLHEVEGAESETPIGWDERLIKALDLPDAKSARGILWRVFSNDYAVTVFHNEFMEWQKEADPEADEELLGESVGAS